MSTENEELELKEQADGTVHVTDPGDKGETNATADDQDGDDEEGSSGQDERTSNVEAGDSESDEVKNPKTEQNRLRRDARKQRAHDRNERMMSELKARDAVIADLTARIQRQESKTSGTEMVHVDEEIRKSADAYNYFKRQIAEAHGNPDAGTIMADATEKMVLASNRYADLNRVKKQMIERQNQPPAIDPVLLKRGQDWVAKNPWYNPNGGDEDSDIALVVDRALLKEGWNARTTEYWDELDKRIAKRLPHRYKSNYTNENDSHSQQRPRSVVTGSGRESNGSGNGSSGYVLSAERVAAIKEAGLWDSPKDRAESIRRYRQYDKEQGATK